MRTGPKSRDAAYYKRVYPEIIKLRRKRLSYDAIGKLLKPPVTRQAVAYICRKAGIANGRVT